MTAFRKLAQIEILEGPFRWPIALPAPFGVHPLEEHPALYVREHGSGGVADSPIGCATILVGRRGTAPHMDDNEFSAFRRAIPLDLRELWRIHALYLVAQLFK
ncbi:MAG: hypothetical protein OXT64_17390 [Gammaproteobacteria bacterium]|nr:hypothetical protein [Gammaproteobacteria bacterium]